MIAWARVPGHMCLHTIESMVRCEELLCRFDLIEQSKRSATAIKAVYSSQPYVIMANVPYFRSYIFFVALMFLGYSTWVLYTLTISGMPFYYYYKITAFERRSCSLSVICEGVQNSYVLFLLTVLLGLEALDCFC